MKYQLGKSVIITVARGRSIIVLVVWNGLRGPGGKASLYACGCMLLVYLIRV